MAHNHAAKDRAKIEAQPTGFPCECICDCKSRHWNISTELCLPCLDASRDNPVQHGEKE